MSRNRGGSPHPLLGTGPFGFEDAGSRAPKRLGDATACATGSFLEAIEMCGRGCGPKEKPPPFSSNLDKDQSWVNCHKSDQRRGFQEAPNVRGRKTKPLSA